MARWIVAVEALECPTLLYNGFGEHNIQGIGDKHIPLIHNVMNTDAAVAISDREHRRALVLFNSDQGKRYLAERQSVPDSTIEHPAPFRILLYLQHPGRYQDGQVPGSRTRRCRRHGGHRWRRDVPQRARQDPRTTLFAGTFDAVTAAVKRSDSILRASRSDHLLELYHTSTEIASSISATSPGSSSRAFRSRTSWLSP